MAGRKKIPTKLKILKGTQRVDRLNPNEPDPECSIPVAPEFLSEEAYIEWHRMSPILLSLGLLADMDMAALALYCQAWGRIVKYEKIIAEKGELYKAQNGTLHVSPVMKIVNTSYDQVYKFLSEFGMSPASRAKVSAKKADKKHSDPFAKLG